MKAVTGQQDDLTTLEGTVLAITYAIFRTFEEEQVWLVEERV